MGKPFYKGQRRLSGKITFKQRLEGRKRRRHVAILGKSIPGRGNSKINLPAMGASLTY
jgi:hypothetical protein